MSSHVQKLRVCHLIAPGPIAGAERVVLCGCEALLQHGLSLTLTPIRDQRVPHFAETFADVAATQGLPTSDFLHARKRLDFPLLKSLRESISNFDVVHSHGYKAFLYSLFARTKNVRLVHTHHGDTSRGLVMRVYQALTYMQMKRADGVFAVSNRMHDQLQRYVPAQKLHLVENMLVLPNVTATLRTPHQTDRPIRLVVVGRLSPEKGLNVLLDAVATLDATKPHLTFVGEGNEEPSLREKTSQLGLEDYVEFVGFQKDVVPFLANADGLAIPSFREGLPLTLIEATALELPVVGTNVGGIPSVVEHGKNGILCPPNDARALANAIEEFSRGFVQLKNVAQERSAEIRERFSPAKWAKQTLQVYHEVVST